VFALGEHRWMLVIGDVCGKGPRAAGVTALARHTLRTAALLGRSPREMLETVHAALRTQPVGADLCTICLVTLERSAQRASLTVALAGHPPPLVLGRDGARRQIGAPGTLLGVIDPIRINEVRAELAPGETLLLYTDGLIETGASDRQLADRLALGALAGEMEPSLETTLERLVRSAAARTGDRLRDDIALVAARLCEIPRDG